jgi:ectoine hydroxylase-related dioxygenase (phytanoyl-CoA dioxygenase family)
VDTSLLPTLNHPYDLPATSTRLYREDGALLLPGLLSDAEVMAYGPHVERTIWENSTEPEAVDERDTAIRKAFVHVVNLWERNPACRQLALSARLGRVAADLLEVDAVRLFYDQAMFKEPGGEYTPWHQDAPYFPRLDRNKFVTIWLPLVHVEAGMDFVLQSHRHGRLSKLSLESEISYDSERYYADLIHERHWNVTNYGAMSAGDATAHPEWTLHRAHPNRSSQVRGVIAFIYYADGARVMELDDPDIERERIEKELNRLSWRPGGFAAGPRNPVAYVRPSRR